ncbi:hypothetical protein BJ138DRAFT_1109654 [Hygrophoropsis aurantiaca]|uniref:Uncharacterized protein n=1 Tax=Hygrophoropsis aurantiaca TaxID=72124 RepID=A0ACB8AR66_9AGAM|nr:hypothetical protein BJ138DRAFT_1109654 [Hygrophoropsis aurantiaca]
MRVCPLNYDVIVNILDNLEPHTPASLLSCALTCHEFLQPSLNLLWRSQDSLGPLIMYTMPKDTWCIKDDYWIHFQKDLYPSDLERLLVYAARIRHLEHNQRRCTFEHHPHWSTLLALMNVCSGSSLLPNLTILDCSLISRLESIDMFIPFLSTLITPRIRRLSLDLPLVDCGDTFLDLMLRECLYCEELVLSSIHPITLTRSPSHIPHLRIFNVEGAVSMTQSAVRCLASKQGLEDVTLNVSSRDETDASPLFDFRDNSTFSSLSHITLHTETLPVSISIMQAISSSCVKSITINIRDYISPSLLLECLETLCSSTSFLSEVHSLTIHRREPREISDSPITLVHLTPIFSLRHLRSFTLKNLGIIELDDASMTSVGQAWPLMEHLVLISAPCPAPPPSQISFNGVISLINWCPNLQGLSIGYDMIMAGKTPRKTHRPKLPGVAAVKS